MRLHQHIHSPWYNHTVSHGNLHRASNQNVVYLGPDNHARCFSLSRVGQYPGTSPRVWKIVPCVAARWLLGGPWSLAIGGVHVVKEYAGPGQPCCGYGYSSTLDFESGR